MNSVLTEQQVAANLVTFLETLRRQWALYVGSSDPEVVVTFMRGMSRAFFISGNRDLMPLRDMTRDALFEECGWNSAGSLIDQMREAGMNDAGIIDELLRVEIEAVRRRMDLPGGSELPVTSDQ